MKKNGITQYDGRGTFLDAHTLEVATADGGTETVTFDHCVIAAGASTRLLPGTSVTDRVVTYEEQILSADLPDSMVIVGAGAIGVDM